MSDTHFGNVQDLQPWIVVSDDGPACWRLQDDRIALAMFSSQDKANAYANAAELHDWQALQPEPTDLVRTLMLCVAAAIEIAVLDPDQASARRVFDLPNILRQVRSDLREGKPLTW
ncbi:MAG: hypothetical protein R3C05_01560 [Pirellulaceae bacterium]